MINRALIRIKVVQILFAYYQNTDRSLGAILKELSFSLDKAYELYNYLLLLLVNLKDTAQARIDRGYNKMITTEADLHPNLRFVENTFINQLSENLMLASYKEANKISWENHEDFVRRLLDKIMESDIVKEYMAKDSSTYEEDRELWRQIYKTFICQNEDLDEILEEESLYWNDDKETIDTFVLKTIRRFEISKGSEMELLPEFRDAEDRGFATTLLETAIKEEQSFRSLIEGHIRNWDISRVAFMDVVIMQAALAEILAISGIPVTVTLNEYVDIAKSYSTPKSGGFVNGTLDGIVRTLRAQKKLIK